MYAPRNLTLVAWAIAGATAIGATTARASPRSEPTTGRAVFTGSTSSSASSITLDPAALGIGSVGEVLIAVTGLVDHLAIARTGASTAHATSTTFAPGAEIGLIYRTGDRFTVGVDAKTPPAEQFADAGDALRYHSLGGHQRDYIASVAASVRATNSFFVGASLSHDNTLLHLRYARDTALAAGHGPGGIDSDCEGAPCGIENPAASELFDVRVRTGWLSTSNLRINIGAVIQPFKDVWFGIAYHTPPGLGIESSLQGNVDVTLPARDGGQVLHGQANVLVSFPAGADAELRARLPRLLDLRIGGRWEDLSRFRAYDVRTFKHTFAEYGVPELTRRPRGFHDPFAIWGGVEQVDVGQALRFGGRIGVETAAVDADKTSPFTTSPTSLTLDGGAQWRFAPSWMLQISYGIQVAPAVTVTKSAFDPQSIVECIDSEYDYSTAACAAARDGYAIDSAAGTYSKLSQSFRLALRYELP